MSTCWAACRKTGSPTSRMQASGVFARDELDAAIVASQFFLPSVSKTRSAWTTRAARQNGVPVSSPEAIRIFRSGLIRGARLRLLGIKATVRLVLSDHRLQSAPYLVAARACLFRRGLY